MHEMGLKENLLRKLNKSLECMHTQVDDGNFGASGGSEGKSKLGN